MKSAEIRQKFLDYFKAKGHTVVPSSPLVPANDPTLLFTNAGMVQFKDTFLGNEKREYVRAASSQRCVRAGGKHNDLENVGYTARHHTFFEMLGNFSFGDYFKDEAIAYAWEFLTQVLKLPTEKLWVTVFEEDDEAADIWLKKIGVDPKRFSRIGAKDNFWSMGDTGPCGPCSEIFYDHGESVPGGPPGTPEEDGDRYIEIWNLVFMQYNRDSEGKLHDLPKPSVDTGMGLERLAAILQGVHSNYEIDLFQQLIAAAAKLTGCKDLTHASLRVIADHIRACSFLIVDGVLPSRDGRGYVLRRIIRRAVRHGRKLGVEGSFFYKLVAKLVGLMGEAFPELKQAQPQVEKQLKLEEERFAETVDKGLEILEQEISGLKGKVLGGEFVFKLYDTYGFPDDLTADIARERGLSIDKPRFDELMEEQRQRGKQGGKFNPVKDQKLDLAAVTQFVGYEKMALDKAKIVALFMDAKPVKKLTEGDEAILVLDSTPFYAESGGQVGDQGVIQNANATFRVHGTYKQGDAFLHVGTLEQGQLSLNDSVDAHIDNSERRQIAYNHSATHLLHAALRKILGEHVTQKGSLVEASRLRFDFSHFEALSGDEIHQLEQMVNEKIRENIAVETRLMGHKAALEAGAMALFGEKYGDEVRVLSMGDFSVELCGGTHVSRTGDIGVFKIISEQGTAAGVRRIEAVTGPGALAWFDQQSALLNQLAASLKTSVDKLGPKIEQTLQHNRALEKELEQLNAKLASQQSESLLSGVLEIDGLKVLAARMDGVDTKTLRETADQLKNKLGSAAVILGSVNGEKVSLVAGVTKDQTKRIAAGALVNAVAQQVGGKGGGRPDMAMAGGTEPANLDEALNSVEDWIRSQL